MYSRRVGDRTLTFGVSGMLKNNALIMFDAETKSVWSHITGEALGGPLKGRRLGRIASVPKVTWRTVQREYPEAKVLRVHGRIDRPRSAYADYHADESAVGVRPMSAAPDRRLSPKTFVAGVGLADAAKAYPHAVLARRGLIHDTVGETPVVVARVPEAEAIVVFDRRLGDRTLTFENLDPRGRMRDRETKSLWSALRGVALEGPLEGKSLTRLPHVDSYWFGWHAYYPKTEVYREN